MLFFHGVLSLPYIIKSANYFFFGKTAQWQIYIMGWLMYDEIIQKEKGNFVVGGTMDLV